jgi:hypothetical protein
MEPSVGAGGGPSMRRELVERARTMQPATTPEPSPLVQAATRLIAPAPAAPPSRQVEAEEDEDSEVERAERDGGEIAGAGAASAAPPPGSLGPRLQRTSLPELFVMMTSREPPDGNLLADDDVQTLTRGQMRKHDFLRDLRAEVMRVADTELRRVGRTAADCPYIPMMLDRYEGRTAAQIERSVRRYAPEVRTAREAQQYIPMVAERIGRGVRQWAETGRMPDDLPDEAMMSLRTAGGWVGAVAAIAGLQGPAPDARGSASGGESGGDGGGGGGASATTPRRKAIGPSPGRVDGAAIMSQLGPGRPLDGTTRGRMEAGFGHSFAAVRIHADETAADLNRDLAARAFTIGAHVALGAGAPSPGTLEGDALLAHELAHVVQQGTMRPVGDIPVGAAGDELEHDADRAAEAVVVNLHAPSPLKRKVEPRRARGGLRLQRCGSSYHARTAADLQTAIPLIRTVQSTYGVTFTEESANWEPDEVAAINEALGLLSERDRAAVGPGVVFARVASTGARGGGLDADALTSTGAERRGGTPTRVKRVAVANSFSRGNHAGMVRVAVHELGHIIDSARAHDTRVELMRTADAIDPARGAASTAHGAFVAAWNTTAAAGGSTSSYTTAETRAFTPFFNAIDGSVHAYLDLFAVANDPLITNVIRDLPTRDAALTTALADRDREYAALPTSSPGHRAIADFRDVITRQDAAVTTMRSYIRARIANEQASRAHAASVVGTDPNEVSQRRVAFQQVVDANGIGPLVWPDGPRDPTETYTGRVLRHEGRARFIEEMFAEAFSMWRTERATLQSQAPALVDFFDNGGHLQ